MPMEGLCALAQDPDVGVRKMIVLNAQVPEEILHTLAQNEDKGLQYLLCLRGKVEGLEYKKGGQDPVWLWRDPGMWLKDIEDFLERGNNHATIAEQLIDVVTKLSLPDPLLQAIIANLAAHWDDSIKTEFEDDWIDLTYDSDGSEGDWRELLAAAFMPPIALRKLASSPGWKVRYLVALHPQTPWETRQQLCQDGNRYVRAMARATSEQIPRPA